MMGHADILDQPERISRAFLGALALHAAVIGGLTISTWLAGRHDLFGAPDAGGAAVGVEAVKSIPLPHQGQPNPLANDSESQVPQQPAKPVERVKKEKPPPDAVAIKTRKTKKTPAEVASERQRFRPFNQLEPNQLYSKSAPQVSNPLFSAVPGAGRVGTGPNTTLGNRFAGYAAQIQQIIAQKWRTGDVNAQIRTGPVVIADFDLMRDGTIRNFRLLQSSGIPALDSSIQRAILDANPLPPIPAGFERDYAVMEFSFELNR